MSGEKEETFSVWALPPEDVKERIHKLASALKSEFGGLRCEPAHISLASFVRLTPTEALRRFRSSCEGDVRLKPYTARVASVAHGETFRQCVYLLLDPKPEVLAAGDHMCHHLGCQRTSTYTPYLPLLCGDLSAEQKKKATERVKELDEGILDLSFEVAEIALYKTDPAEKTVESWERVAHCNIKTGSCSC